MIIEDKELLGDFTIKVLMDGKADVFEPGEQGERRHSITKNNITDAMKYIMERRIVSMDKSLTLTEYFDFVTTYGKQLQDTIPTNDTAPKK
jgi:hypothetical protein